MLRTRRSIFIVLTHVVVGSPWQGAIATLARAELVIHKDGTKLYHRATCPIVRDTTGVLLLTRGQAESRGSTPHADCDPSNPKATPAPDAAAPSPVTVYVDDPRYYHGRTCTRLDPASTTVKALPLEAAATSHWPCPACKAPIYKRNVEPAVPGTNRRRGG